MKIKNITIHNFRSIIHESFSLNDYTVLIGSNNAGKSNIINAIRIFYEDDVKFDENRDFPKLNADGDESWIEIEFELSDEEWMNLKDEYKSEHNKLIVRKYLKSRERCKPNQSNIYAYEKGQLSNNLFYGARNISQAKLGNVVYIPAVSKTEDIMKLSGASPLRKIVDFVIKKVIKNSESYQNIEDTFNEFNIYFKNDVSKDGYSLNNFLRDVNLELQDWGILFDFNIRPIQADDIIKNLIEPFIKDENLNCNMNINLYGSGLQRHLIYTLIKLVTKYKENINKDEKKEFNPELTILLFEEPEAFLHPTQQENLNISLRSISSEKEQQVIITTHSPIFVSKNSEDIPGLVNLKKENNVTKIYQVSIEQLNHIIGDNIGLNKYLNGTIYDEERLKEEESIRYFLWLDSERASSFFANVVLICEGASEKVLIDYLIKNKWEDIRTKKVYVLDAMGKYNIHRYMNLFKNLGIRHSVIVDGDPDKKIK